MIKRQVPLVLTFIMGLWAVVAYFVPHRYVADPAQQFQRWYLIILAFTTVIGVGNLIMVHGEKIQRRQRGWGYSVILIAMILLMAGLGYFGNVQEGTPYYWLYQNVMSNLAAAMFSLLAFFVASASYRAFRARNKEATLLLVAAVIVMFGRVPVGSYLYRLIPWVGTHYPNFMNDLTGWIMNFPNTAGQRGIMIGAALGAVSMALRMLLGIERSYLAASGGK